MSLTFLQLQASVMSDRFAEEQRGDVKNWINAGYWQTWAAEEWTFKYGTSTVSVTSGSTAVSGLPADFAVARSLQRGDGTIFEYLTPTEWQRGYYSPRAPYTNLPDSYTIINGQMFVGPASSETASDYLLVYEKEFTALVNDGDTPAIPSGADMALVFKASATGLKLQNDFTWQFHEQDYQEQLDAMRRSYLVNVRDRGGSYAADPLGYLG